MAVLPTHNTDISIFPFLCCVDLNGVDSSGSTALHMAAEADRADSVDFLLSAGADPGIKNGKGNLPLHIAVEQGFLNVVKVKLLQISILMNSLKMMVMMRF